VAATLARENWMALDRCGDLGEYGFAFRGNAFSGSLATLNGPRQKGVRNEVAECPLVAKNG